MRLYSTKESTAAGEPTVLAIVETLLATGLLIWLSLHYNTTRWLAVAVCLSPLSLLKTEDSVQRGLRWNGKVGLDGPDDRLIFWACAAIWFTIFKVVWRELGPEWGLSMFLLGIIPTAVLAVSSIFFAIRWGATFSSMLKHPLVSISAIPGNWQRIVIATDSATDPEFIPGDARGPLHMLSNARRETQATWSWLGFLMAAPLYPLTAAYRWSVKATCLIYTPLRWVAGKVRFSPPDVKLALEDYQVDPVTRLRAVFTVVVLGFFAAKVGLMAVLNGFAAWCDTTPGLQWLSLLIAPGRIPLWHIAGAGNSVLFLCLWRYAWKQSRLYNTGRAPDDARVLRVWRTLTVLSAVLSLYTIGCHVAILVREGDPLSALRALWETIEGRLWP